MRNDDVFSEIETQIEINDGKISLEDLAGSVAGKLGIDKEEMVSVRKYVKIFDELDLLKITDEGNVKLVSSEKTSEEGELEEHITEKVSVPTEKEVEKEKTSKISANLEISLNASDMEASDIKEKIKAIKESLEGD